MGIGPFKRTSESGWTNTPVEKEDPNKCTIDRIQIFGDKYIVVQLQYSPKYYPNHGGKKIAVYQTGLLNFINEYGKTNSLDPHFTSDSKVLAPIARFSPSDESWVSAIRYVESEIKALSVDRTHVFQPNWPHTNIFGDTIIRKCSLPEVEFNTPESGTNIPPSKLPDGECNV